MSLLKCRIPFMCSKIQDSKNTCVWCHKFSEVLHNSTFVCFSVIKHFLLLAYCTKRPICSNKVIKTDGWNLFFVNIIRQKYVSLQFTGVWLGYMNFLLGETMTVFFLIGWGWIIKIMLGSNIYVGCPVSRVWKG